MEEIEEAQLSKNIEQPERLDEATKHIGPKDKDELTMSQRLFVFEIIQQLKQGGKKNLTQAAIKAGYSPESACVQASRMMAIPKIRKMVEEEMRKIERYSLISAASIMSDIQEIGDRCMQGEPVLDNRGNPTGEWKFDAYGALRSRELLGKHFEYFTDKVKQSGEVTVKITVNEENPGKMPKRIGGE